MAVNKVVYGNTPLLDLTSDTVEENKVMAGYTFHDKSGALKTGLAGAYVEGTTLHIPANATVSGSVLHID